MVSTPLLTNRAYDIRWDALPDLRVLGYSVYRSYNQTGDYVRLTNTTIQTNSFRDMNSDTFVNAEQIPQRESEKPYWKIDVDKEYKITTAHCPIVEAGGFGIPSLNPDDVVVEIDGVAVRPKFLNGETGEIILNSGVYFDPLRNEFVEPKLPELNSDVRVSYWYQSNFLNREQTKHYPPYYKVTAVAYDVENGRLIETDPDLVEPTTLHIEQLDWIWKEAIRRNAWIAEISGERVLAFQHKKSGVLCGCVYRDYGTYHPSRDCEECFGTGFIGGYDDPKPLIVVIPFAEKGFSIEETRGLRRSQSLDSMWAPPDPLMEQFDLIMRQDGTLFQIGPVLRPNHRGHMALQQRFTAEYLPFHHVQYKLLETLDQFNRTLNLPDGRNTLVGANDNSIHLLSEKSPEPTIHFKGKTNRYSTIAY
jgi:hypothetical protein